VVFYSYANTNIISGGSPALPNAEFYRAAGEAFGDPVPPPVFPWKARPERGQVYGWLAVEPGPAWRTVAQDLGAGAAVLFHMFLKEADFSGVLPRVSRAAREAASPGGLVALSGSNFAAEFAPATAVPLPLELAGAQVLVNGTAAPLFSVSPERLELRMPCLPAPSWNIVVRRAGLESAPFRLSAAAATPVILGVRQPADGYLETCAWGLGAANPPARAGSGGAAARRAGRVHSATALCGSHALPARPLSSERAGAPGCDGGRIEVAGRGSSLGGVQLLKAR
jgi:uncharacterized protein (TIGR03437 family)